MNIYNIYDIEYFVYYTQVIFWVLFWSDQSSFMSTFHLFGRHFWIFNFQIKQKSQHLAPKTPVLFSYFHCWYHSYLSQVMETWLFCVLNHFPFSWPDLILYNIAQCKEKQKAKIVSQVDQVNKEFSCCLHTPSSLSREANNCCSEVS